MQETLTTNVSCKVMYSRVVTNFERQVGLYLDFTSVGLVGFFIAPIFGELGLSDVTLSEYGAHEWLV